MTIAFFDRLQQETEQERQALFSLPIIQRALQGQINQAQYIASVSYTHLTLPTKRIV